MEKERAFAGNWPSTDGILPPEMCAGAGAEQLPHSFLNVVWEQPTPHAQAHFESALSSLVSSPSSNAPAGNDSVVIRELIGRLGSICNSGDISPPSGYHSARTSCYSTPLNSPPKLNLSGADHHQQGRGGLPKLGNQVAAAQFGPFAADPAFAERAARFSCFGPRTQGGLGAQLRLPEAGTLSRVSNSQSLMAATGREVSIASPDRMEAERSKFGGRTPGTSSPEASSASDRLTAGGGGGNGRKRKAASKGKSKGVPLSSSTSNPAQEDNSDIKRCKPAETNEPDNNEAARPNTEPIRDGGQKQGEENNAKAALEPPKDYIHVRARRGQATDSHSLAERVRREKISERMKLLQDLVPGCNKITGKAVMLDEIINYVQSLQRQVEFLSMKLATLNPQLEFDMENLLPKDMHQTQTHGPLPPQFYPLDMATSAFPYAQHPQGAAPLQTTVANGLTAQGSLNPVDSFLRRTSSLQLAPLDGFADPASQLGNMYEDDLQYFVQMGSGQSQGTAFATQTSLHHE